MNVMQRMWVGLRVGLAGACERLRRWIDPASEHPAATPMVLETDVVPDPTGPIMPGPRSAEPGLQPSQPMRGAAR